ncbi:MAG: DUF2508 family protein [Acutalibacteraceae bacterium]
MSSINRYKCKKYRKMTEEELLISEIENVRKSIHLAYFKIAYNCDNELLESAIYELKSLECKHKHLLNEIKEKGITV